MAIIMRNGLKINFDPNKMRAGELAVVTDARELHATFAPGDSPEVLLAPETDGTEGQVLALEDGEPTWKSVASPTDAQVDAAVDDWLDAHPEATTTVQDGAITYAKLDSNLKGTVDDVGELKSDKADADGTYSTLTAGNLTTDDGSNNNTPYLFRASGGGVKVGEREYDKIVGGTVAWNQLVNKNNYAESGTSNGVTYTNNDDGSWTITGTADGLNSSKDLMSILNAYVVGHVYLFYTGINSGSWSNYVVYDYNNNGSAAFESASMYYGRIGKPANTTARIRCQVWNGKTINIKTTPMIFDLTQMFGTTIAEYLYSIDTTVNGSGLAKLREWGFFTQSYYPYNLGELKSVEGLTSHEMVGFNQWDEEWEKAQWGSRVDGVVVKNTATNQICCKNPIPVFPDTTYFFSCGKFPGLGTAYADVMLLDGDMKFLQYYPSGEYTGRNTKAIVTTSKTRYVVFNMYVSYDATYLNDICINLSDPAKNGTYEPYVKHTYPLDSDLTLRGIPKLDSNNSLYYDGDTYESDGTVTRRYGIVDLGTLNWDSSVTNVFFANGNSLGFLKRSSIGIICPLYEFGGQASASSQVTNDKHIYLNVVASGYDWVFIKDTAYSDAATFKSAMSGVYLVYELATATSETAEPFAAPQIVDQYGTEEYVTTGIVPVGHETFYPENLRQKIEGLPWNFASLIAPTEVIYKATQNYTSGSLFIVDNVLYKATANIANGGTITPGTNCQATTLAAVIAAL